MAPDLYHVGLLMLDRLNNRAVHTIATRVWKQYKEGKVHLVQRRRGLGVCEYWSIPNTGGRYVGNRNPSRDA